MLRVLSQSRSSVSDLIPEIRGECGKELRINIVWIPHINGLHGEAKLLGMILRALYDLNVDVTLYSVFNRDYPSKMFSEIEMLLDKYEAKVIEANRSNVRKVYTRLGLEACKLCKQRKSITIIRAPNDYFLTSFSLCMAGSNISKFAYYVGFFGTECLTPLALLNFKEYSKVNDANRNTILSIIKSNLKRLPMRVLPWLLSSAMKYSILSSTLIALRIPQIINKPKLFLRIFIDTNFFRYNRLVPYSDKSIVTVARIHRHKRLDLFVKVIEKISKLDDEVKATIVGDVIDKEYYDYLVSLVRSAKLNINIIPKGSPLIVRDAYWSHNILLNVSDGALGIVNAEASVCGTVPVVHEFFIDGVTPYAFIYRQYKQIIPLIHRLFTNEDILKRHSRLGAKIAEKIFSYERFVQEIKNIILALEKQ